MALTLSEKFDGLIGGRRFKGFEVTCDGSVTTVTANSMDMDTIEVAFVTSPADLRGTETKDFGSIDIGNELAEEIDVTGAVLGDIARASINVDVIDATISAAVTAAGKVTFSIGNNTAGAVDLAEKTILVEVDKKIGLTTFTGSYVVFSPALQSTDVFVLWVIGY